MGPTGEDQYRALFGAILENAVDAIITIDERGTVESINPAGIRMFGYPAEEVIGQNVNILMPPPDRERHDGYLERYRETGDRRIIGIGREVEGQRKDGSRFPLSLAVSEVAVGDRRIFAGFVRDITEIHHAEAELRKERDFAESLIETAQTIVLVLDPEGRIVRFNRYLEELSGYRLEEVKGKDWFQTFLPKRDRASVSGVFKNAVSEMEIKGHVNPIVTKSGEEREIAWWARTLRDADGAVTGVLSVGQDVTELREAQGRLMQSERLAAIGQMITGLAHESRNALQRMQACLEMLALEVEDRPQAMDYVGRIQSAQDYLGQLYEEVRGYAAPIQLDKSMCDLRRLWGAAWSDLAVSRSDRRVELEDGTEGRDLTCLVDPFAFGQVFLNILQNALAAVEDGGHIAIAARDAELDGTRALEITVCDDGPGLTADQQKRIFRPFFSTKTQGTGLGMAIVRRVLDAHGGTVEIGRGALSGAAIVVTVPVGGG